MLKTKLKKLLDNINMIPDVFWIDSERLTERVIWVLDREDGSAGDYETSQERLGITKEGRIIWGFSSGCSCWEGWSKDDYQKSITYKEFLLKKIQTFDKGDSYPEVKKEYDFGFADGWEDESCNALDDFLLLVKKNLTLNDVFSASNAEIRRYLIKRFGYDKIRKSAEVKVIHTDGTSELIDLTKDKVTDRYVKVKDSSTDREYLLYVPNDMKTCKEAIAWTFNLKANEYNPIIET